MGFGDVEKKGDFDVLMEKWNDVLSRDIDWKLKDSWYAKEGFKPDYDGDILAADTEQYKYRDKKDAVKADFTEGEQNLHFECGRILYKASQKSSEKLSGADYSGIFISYAPDLSGKELSLQLFFTCSGGRTIEYYTWYRVIVGFNSKSGEKKGRAEMQIENGYDCSKPRNSDYECIVGENFYSMLIGFCKKMKETAMENVKKKEQAEQNNIKDEFDSL